MLSFLHCIRSDFYKFRHTSMLLIHLLLPLGVAAAFLAYFTISPWRPDAKISGYFEMIGVSFPLIIGLVCSKSIEQEGQAGSFQNMLCGTKSRTAVFLSKLIVMLLLGACSIVLAIGTFAVGFKVAPPVNLRESYRSADCGKHFSLYPASFCQPAIWQRRIHWIGHRGKPAFGFGVDRTG